MFCFFGLIKLDNFVLGDLFQLPPIFDNLVTDNNNLDGRPSCSPSHWEEHFKIYYLTEKMRSQKDPFFSDLCDRVKVGAITDSDKEYLLSRVKNCESENYNDSFKSNKLLIIVTTNTKKDMVNQQKLRELLPTAKEYTCTSDDRVTNLPTTNKVPKKLNLNPGKTGNLQAELILKVGAPIIITKNHSKQRFREDGICNGARGYVQAIQCSKNDPDKVEIVWIVLHNENMGKLYQFEHRHLRKNFNPGHKRAIPILPTRTTFKTNFGNVEYQRTNFPLSLAYAVTAHKSQGDTLDEIIIDFESDEEYNIKNYIICGSFYVALTRVREGKSVFLRGFDPSYIQVNPLIQAKIDAMIKFRPYVFKKTYLDEKIFVQDNNEFKAGYLNINGLKDGNHGQYLNADKNLIGLDILVLAETKLVKSDQHGLEDLLNNWSIKGRYDSGDGQKHMGLMLLKNNKSRLSDQLSIEYKVAKRRGAIQIQGLVVTLNTGSKFGFVYCRSTPSNAEVEAIKKSFCDCSILIGDFNISHRVKSDQEKLSNICGLTKVSILTEITRSVSNNQLDYILVDKDLVEKSFSTAFNNFISDHKSITIRIGLNENQFTEEFKVKQTFDQESHLKPKETNMLSESSESDNAMAMSDSNSSASIDVDDPMSVDEEFDVIAHAVFSRRFKNLDSTTCWLNSCLQLFLIALDHENFAERDFTSDLGKAVWNLFSTKRNDSLDATSVKNILNSTEDTRIAIRISELEATEVDFSEVQRKAKLAEASKFDLFSGEQCVREFLNCLNTNQIFWPDIASTFMFSTSHSTICCSCNHRVQSMTDQLYIELDVPPDNSNLNDYIEEHFNTSDLIGKLCDGGCSKFTQSEKRTQITDSTHVKFLLVVLSRGIQTEHGFGLNKNRTIATNDVFIRYFLIVSIYHYLLKNFL